MMIASCPTGTNRIEKMKCTRHVQTHNNHMFEIPVRGDDGFLYKNVFCAHCNLVSRFTWVDYDVTCEDEFIARCFSKRTRLISPLNGLKHCKYRLKLPQSTLSQSCRFKDHCRNKGKITRFNDYCKAYLAPYAGFKNPHCTFCNLVNGEYKLSHKNMHDCSLTIVHRHNTPLVSILINVHHNDTKPQIHFHVMGRKKYLAAKAECYNGTIQSEFIQVSCSSVSCPMGYSGIKSECIRVTSASVFHGPIPLLWINVFTLSYGTTLCT